MSKAALYCWIGAFKESDPDVFGGYAIAHAGDGKRNWYEHVRETIKASTAIERAPPLTGGLHLRPRSPS